MHRTCMMYLLALLNLSKCYIIGLYSCIVIILLIDPNVTKVCMKYKWIIFFYAKGRYKNVSPLSWEHAIVGVVMCVLSDSLTLFWRHFNWQEEGHWLEYHVLVKWNERNCVSRTTIQHELNTEHAFRSISTRGEVLT